jgi:hypothetical protein
MEVLAAQRFTQARRDGGGKRKINPMGQVYFSSAVDARPVPWPGYDGIDNSYCCYQD